MRRKAKLFVFLSVFLLTCGGPVVTAAGPEDFPGLKGPYLGQKLPGLELELFAPGIVNTGMYTRDLAMTPDGKEIYFCVSVGNNWNTILVTREVNGRWTEPEVAPTMDDPRVLNFEPCISPDGNYFFFMSNRFLPREKWPAKLSYGHLREAYSGMPNGNSAIYWVDARVIESLRPDPGRAPADHARRTDNITL